MFKFIYFVHISVTLTHNTTVIIIRSINKRLPLILANFVQAVLSLDGSQPCFTAHTLQVNYQVASHACSLAGGYSQIYKESGRGANTWLETRSLQVSQGVSQKF